MVTCDTHNRNVSGAPHRFSIRILTTSSCPFNAVADPDMTPRAKTTNPISENQNSRLYLWHGRPESHAPGSGFLTTPAHKLLLAALTHWQPHDPRAAVTEKPHHPDLIFPSPASFNQKPLSTYRNLVQKWICPKVCSRRPLLLWC
jgi:hypothetical protein